MGLETSTEQVDSSSDTNENSSESGNESTSAWGASINVKTSVEVRTGLEFAGTNYGVEVDIGASYSSENTRT